LAALSTVANNKETGLGKFSLYLYPSVEKDVQAHPRVQAADRRYDRTRSRHPDPHSCLSSVAGTKTVEVDSWMDYADPPRHHPIVLN